MERTRNALCWGISRAQYVYLAKMNIQRWLDYFAITNKILGTKRIFILVGKLKPNQLEISLTVLPARLIKGWNKLLGDMESSSFEVFQSRLNAFCQTQVIRLSTGVTVWNLMICNLRVRSDDLMFPSGLEIYKLWLNESCKLDDLWGLGEFQL